MDNWSACANGPTDENIHPEKYLNQPCHGIREGSNVDIHSLKPGDLVLARQSGGNSSGVRGIWEYQDKQQIDDVEQELWDDAKYEWMLYCTPIERELDSVISEDWHSFANRIDDTVQAATFNMQGAIVNLSQTIN